jgi:arginyl-tRNA synthetase
MIKVRILQQLADALRHAAPELNNLTVDESLLSGLRLERPRNADHGDYAVNVSFLAKSTKMPPPKIAAAIARFLPGSEAFQGESDFSVSVLGGYLNFTISESVLREALSDILHQAHPGQNASLNNERILLEYVSANPTGPLHVGHGRWAALGDSLVRILRHCGALVTPEFYINDFGFQMEKMALSLWWRSVECLKNQGDLPGTSADADVLQGRELPYAGEFVIGLAQELLKEADYRQALLAEWALYQQTAVNSAECNISDVPGWQDNIKLRLIAVAKPRLLGDQQALLDTMRVHFDVWTSETEALHQSGAVEKTLATLQEKEQVYTEDGALWFRSETYGDEKNRVLQKQDGSYTYLTADIAYHHEKCLRPAPDGQPYTRLLNIWGADHHGYIARLKGSIEALGHDASRFEVLLGQLVNLVVDGERTRMGKRRRMLTLRDVVDEVGVDATRFWMVSKSADSTLDFDVDLAASANSENPVFYVQYAHARCCSIIRNATEAAPNVNTGETVAPILDAAEFEQHVQALTPADLCLLFDSLDTDNAEADVNARTIVKNLLVRLDGFEEMVKDAARMRAPHFLTQYMMDLSAQFHSFYGVCRILTPDAAITRVRLLLIVAIRNTLAQALDLLGVSAPDRM